MKRKLYKKIALYTSVAFLLLVVVLAVHIYIVTRPKAPDANTRAMARIDIRQNISRADADRITAWLYTQNGIDHVLCNPESSIVVFTFAPVKTNASLVVSNFKSVLGYRAERYMPSAEELQSGCPVSPKSTTFKVYNYFKKIL